MSNQGTPAKYSQSRSSGPSTKVFTFAETPSSEQGQNLLAPNEEPSSSDEQGPNELDQPKMPSPDESPVLAPETNKGPSVQIDLNSNVTKIIQPIPILQKKKNILGSGTFKTFMKRGGLDLGMPFGSPMKSRPDILRKGESINLKSKAELSTSFKHATGGGKMFVNELWSRKYHHDVIHSSFLAHQREELVKVGFQTAEEKAKEMNELYTLNQPGRESLDDDLLTKYRSTNKITEKDLLIEPNFDYSIIAYQQDRATSNYPPDNLNNSSKNAAYIDLNLSKESGTTRSNSPNVKRIRGYYLPPIDSSPLTLKERLIKAGSFRMFPKTKTETTLSPGSTARHLTPHKRSMNKIRSRPQLELNENNDSKDYSYQNTSITNTTRMLPPTSKSAVQRYSENDSPSDKTTNLFDLSREKANKKLLSYGLKSSISQLVSKCRAFHEDKNLLKMINQATETFGNKNVIRVAKERKQKAEVLNHEYFIKYYSNITDEKKKREEGATRIKG